MSLAFSGGKYGDSAFREAFGYDDHGCRRIGYWWGFTSQDQNARAIALLLMHEMALDFEGRV